jgi:hypothetical protein
MSRSRIDFQSRISARAIVAGVVSSYALLFLFATLAGGLGFWEFSLSGPPQLNNGFWITSSIAWILSSFGGAFVAATVGRSESVRDGALHGVVAWASACVLGASLFSATSGDVFGNTLTGATPAALFSTFFGNALALVASLAGGRRAARYEAMLSRRDADKETDARIAA